jgi:hypothetical protein
MAIPSCHPARCTAAKGHSHASAADKGTLIRTLCVVSGTGMLTLKFVQLPCHHAYRRYRRCRLRRRHANKTPDKSQAHGHTHGADQGTLMRTVCGGTVFIAQLLFHRHHRSAQLCRPRGNWPTKHRKSHKRSHPARCTWSHACGRSGHAHTYRLINGRHPEVRATAVTYPLPGPSWLPCHWHCHLQRAIAPQ